MVYTFVIKNNKTDIELALTRAMLAVAAVAAYVYPNESYYFLSYILSALLLLASLSAKLIGNKIKSGKYVMLLLAALILFFTSGQIYFSLILIFYGGVLKFLIKDTIITVTAQGISIKNIFGTSNQPWTVFSNVIIKDGLLSFDLKNNKVRYIAVAEEIDEEAFNSFCFRQLHQDA